MAKIALETLNLGDGIIITAGSEFKAPEGKKLPKGVEQQVAHLLEEQVTASEVAAVSKAQKALDTQQKTLDRLAEELEKSKATVGTLESAVAATPNDTKAASELKEAKEALDAKSKELASETTYLKRMRQVLADQS